MRASSRSTGPIDRAGGRKASPIRSMPIPLLEPRCPALRRSCRSYGGRVEAIRALRVARSSAVKARSQAMIRSRPSSSPVRRSCASSCATCPAGRSLRPAHGCALATISAIAEQATKTALRRLARRHQQLIEEIAEADHRASINWSTRSPRRCSPFPALDPRSPARCSPAPATTRTGSGPKPPSRTSAASRRSPPAADAPAGTALTVAVTATANNALYVVVLGRMRHDPRTRAYVERRTHEGLAKPEIIRCLKRYVAREYNHYLTRAKKPDNYLPA